MKDARRVRLRSGFTESPLTHEQTPLYSEYILAEDYDALMALNERMKKLLIPLAPHDPAIRELFGELERCGEL